MKIINYSIIGILLFVSVACKSKTPQSQITGKNESTHLPNPNFKWVSDFEKLLTDKEENYLDSIIRKHEKETSNEIAVVTIEIDKNIIGDITDFEKFTLDLFNTWQIGKENINNGVAIIVSSNGKMIRIEVGFGLENKITNQEAQSIIDSLAIPSFKKAEFFVGIEKTLHAIIEEIK